MERAASTSQASNRSRALLPRRSRRLAAALAASVLVVPLLGGLADASVQESPGLAWAEVPVPSAVYGGLSSVSTSVTTGNLTCMSRTFCVLAGYANIFHYNAKNQLVNMYQPLLWQWHGDSWSDVANPIPGAGSVSTGATQGRAFTKLSGSGVLLGTACSSATDCWAVGAKLTTGAATGVIEHWDGHSWSSSPAHPSLGVWFNAVACTTGGDCFAVGRTGPAVGGTNASSSVLVEQWDGRSWSLLVSGQKPVSALAASLDSVTCVSAQECLALGDWYDPKGDDHFIAEEYAPYGVKKLVNGKRSERWSPVGLFDTSGYMAAMNGTGPYGVSCISVVDCLAVGNGAPYSTYRGAYFLDGVALHWDGSSWSTLATPKLGKYNQSYKLNGVSCASSGCWVALAPYGPVSPASTLLSLAHWDGQGAPFQVVTTAVNGLLDAVSCLPGGSWCMAFGEKVNTTGAQFVALRGVA